MRRILRFRLTGPAAGFDAMMAMLHGMEHVDRVEEVGDLLGGMRDDSSSSELADDDVGNVYDIEVHALSGHSIEHVREMVEACSRDLDVAVEFVDDF